MDLMMLVGQDAVAAGGVEVVPAIVEKLGYIVPEIILFVGTCVVMMLGLSKSSGTRGSCLGVSIAALVAAGVAAAVGPGGLEGSALPGIMPFAKVTIAIVGVLLVLLMAGAVDRNLEAGVASKRWSFDPIKSTRGEFFAFVLFSLTGLMLCASADDLIWLFLALELTSLPTYVMVSISTARSRSQEAGVKYFFLGALGACTFLMGFTLLYGATGTTTLFGAEGIAGSIAREAAAGDGLGMLTVAGLVLSMVGVSFKIAAVPMHFYTADVYEGAQTPVSAFLAFVPKTAGFIGLMLLAATVGWGWTSAGATVVGSGEGAALAMTGGGLPEPVRVMLWVMAALTMTAGNVLALLQSSVKRMLAYSSVAHSGYMIVGLMAGPGDGDLPTNGLAAVMFYLLAYGCMNMGAFAVVACMERRRGDGSIVEVDDIDQLRGLAKRSPMLGWTMVLCSVSLMGLPLAIGFGGKLFLFTAGVGAGEVALVVVLALNSAIAGFYYLRLAFYPLTEERDVIEEFEDTPYGIRRIAAVLSAGSVLALVPFAGVLMSRADEATRFEPGVGVVIQDADAVDGAEALALREEEVGG